MPSARRAANDVRMRDEPEPDIYGYMRKRSAKVRHVSMGKGVDPKGSGVSAIVHVGAPPVSHVVRTSHGPAVHRVDHRHRRLAGTLSRVSAWAPCWRRNRARRDRSSHINGMASERFPRGILNIPPNVSPLTAYERTSSSGSPRIGNRFKSFEIEPLWPRCDPHVLRT